MLIATSANQYIVISPCNFLRIEENNGEFYVQFALNELFYISWDWNDKIFLSV